jgi:hypothetical protein
MMIHDMVSGNQFWRFLKWLTFSAVFGVVLIVFFVFFIDPYNLYGLFKCSGVNAVKPVLPRYVEEIKLTQAIKLKPDTLIFGNSRAEIGLDPEATAFSSRGYAAYNMAIRGASMASSLRQLDYILQKGIKPKRIIIGIDFVDFMNASGAVGLDNQQMAPENTDFPSEKLFWRFDSLFSMSSVKDSINTLFIQNDGEAAIMTERGFNPLKEYLAMARNEGYFVLFRQRAEENAKIYLKKAAGGFDKSGFAYLRSMMKNALDAESEVVLIIYPYHAQILTLFEETGLLPSFTLWKRQVVEEAERYATHTGNSRVTVLDFSGFGERQCERIPAKGDLRSATQWYWEAGHFKKALGDIVLEEALQQLENPKAFPVGDTNFGVSLNSANLDANLQRINVERQKCRGANPQMFAEIDSLVSSLRK